MDEHEKRLVRYSVIMYWPLVLTGLVSAIGAIYTFGFERGKRAVCEAAFIAADEARHG